jgi:hypothetical protein
MDHRRNFQKRVDDNQFVTITLPTIASLDAAQSAVEAPSDTSLRVPYYCEENVWRLAYRKLYYSQQEQPAANSNNKQRDTVTSYYVVFVSNPKGCVPMFQQMASSNKDKPVFWDYHVILLSSTTGTTTSDIEQQPSSSPSSCYVWDIDSYLTLPCPLNVYVQKVFPNSSHWPQEYSPYFR